MGNLLGEGGYGAVFEARWKKKKVAVKVCPGNLVRNLSREIEILTSLPPHPNVLTFFGICLSSDAVSTYIITELDRSMTICMSGRKSPHPIRALPGHYKLLVECSISTTTTWFIAT